MPNINFQRPNPKCPSLGPCFPPPGAPNTGCPLPPNWQTCCHRSVIKTNSPCLQNSFSWKVSALLYNKNTKHFLQFKSMFGREPLSQAQQEIRAPTIENIGNCQIWVILIDYLTCISIQPIMHWFDSRIIQFTLFCMVCVLNTFIYIRFHRLVNFFVHPSKDSVLQCSLNHNGEHLQPWHCSN